MLTELHSKMTLSFGLDKEMFKVASIEELNILAKIDMNADKFQIAEDLMDPLGIFVISTGFCLMCFEKATNKAVMTVASDSLLHDATYFSYDDFFEQWRKHIQKFYFKDNFSGDDKQQIMVDNPYVGSSSIEEMLIRKDLL